MNAPRLEMNWFYICMREETLSFMCSMKRACVCTWRHARQPGQLQGALAVVGVDESHTVSRVTVIWHALKITRAGWDSAFGPVWKCDVCASDSGSLSKSHCRLTSCPYIWKQFPQTFHSLAPSIHHWEGWSGLGSSCTPTPPSPPHQQSQFPTLYPLHTTTSTSVSALSTDRKQPHYCGVRLEKCVCALTHAYLNRGTRVCLWTKQGECLLYSMYEIDGLDKENRQK